MIFCLKALHVTAISFFISFLSFCSFSNLTPMSSTYLDYLKYRYKSNKFSKMRPIFTNFRKSGHLQLVDTFFLHQRCPLISIYLSLSVAHVSNRLRFDLLSYFLFKMVSVVNELPYHKELSPT